MTKLLPSRSGMLDNVLDNVFNAIMKDHRKLFWTAPSEEENRGILNARMGASQEFVLVWRTGCGGGGENGEGIRGKGED